MRHVGVRLRPEVLGAEDVDRNDRLGYGALRGRTPGADDDDLLGQGVAQGQGHLHGGRFAEDDVGDGAACLETRQLRQDLPHARPQVRKPETAGLVGNRPLDERTGRRRRHVGAGEGQALVGRPPGPPDWPGPEAPGRRPEPAENRPEAARRPAETGSRPTRRSPHRVRGPGPPGDRHHRPTSSRETGSRPERPLVPEPQQAGPRTDRRHCLAAKRPPAPREQRRASATWKQ